MLPESMGYGEQRRPATVTARSAGLASGTVDIDVVVPKFERAWWCARHAAL